VKVMANASATLGSTLGFVNVTAMSAIRSSTLDLWIAGLTQGHPFFNAVLERDSTISRSCSSHQAVVDTTKE
jgi:hypothetical protein